MLSKCRPVTLAGSEPHSTGVRVPSYMLHVASSNSITPMAKVPAGPVSYQKLLGPWLGKGKRTPPANLDGEHCGSNHVWQWGMTSVPWRWSVSGPAVILVEGYQGGFHGTANTYYYCCHIQLHGSYLILTVPIWNMLSSESICIQSSKNE